MFIFYCCIVFLYIYTDVFILFVGILIATKIMLCIDCKKLILEYNF